jgi:hypothetical protein
VIGALRSSNTASASRTGETCPSDIPAGASAVNDTGAWYGSAWSGAELCAIALDAAPPAGPSAAGVAYADPYTCAL